jgi:hypothetical protein
MDQLAQTQRREDIMRKLERSKNAVEEFQRKKAKESLLKKEM